jgi:hypothetical protein
MGFTTAFQEPRLVRNSLFRVHVINQQTDTTRLHSFAPSPVPRVFSNFRVYKGKATMAIKVIPPSYRLTAKAKTLSREGVFLFEFAPAGASPNEYDWNQKLTFSMSVVELGELLILNGQRGADFFHDPSLGG